MKTNLFFAIGMGAILIIGGLRCGGTNSAGGGTGTLTGAISGTAAKGAPLAGVTITLKDHNGQSLTTTTGSDGKYSLDVTGLTPPFLVQVSLAGGGYLYSIGTATGVVNLTPLTDLIVQDYYKVSNTTADAAFTGFGAGTSVPTAETIKIIAATVVAILEQWLTQKGIDVSTFDPIGTAFTADGTGVDGVLDLTTVSTDHSTVTITSGTTTQTTTITVDTATSSTTVATSTTGPGGTSTSTFTAVIPTTTAQSDALAGVNAGAAAFKAAMIAKGALLTDADVLPFLAAGAMDDGRTRAQFAANIATSLRLKAGVTITRFEATKLLSLDTANNVATVELAFQQSLGTQTSNQKLEFSFKLEGGKWLLNGNQRLAHISFALENRKSTLPSGTTGFAQDINVDISAPQGIVQSVTITGGPWSNTPVVKDSTVRNETVEATPGTMTLLANDVFFLQTSTGIPAVGTPFTVTVTPVTGTAKTYTVTLNALTTDTMDFVTAPTGTTLAAANLTHSQTLTFTLPTTFPISEVKFGILTFTMPGGGGGGGNQCEVETTSFLSSTSTRVTFTVPDTCVSAHDVKSVNFNLQAFGVNGERVKRDWTFSN